MKKTLNIIDMFCGGGGGESTGLISAANEFYDYIGGIYDYTERI